MLMKRGIQYLKKYCREPIENIKGYREAVESEDGWYVCHHINELTFTEDELKKMNMYYHRPASELIIMSRSEHNKWHHRWNGHPMKGRTGDKNPRWKGDDVGPSGMYKRARRLYKAGKITEEEFQPYRDALMVDIRSRRMERMHNAEDGKITSWEEV